MFITQLTNGTNTQCLYTAYLILLSEAITSRAAPELQKCIIPELSLLAVALPFISIGLLIGKLKFTGVIRQFYK